MIRPTAKSWRKGQKEPPPEDSEAALQEARMERVNFAAEVWALREELQLQSSGVEQLRGRVQPQPQELVHCPANASVPSCSHDRARHCAPSPQMLPKKGQLPV